MTSMELHDTNSSLSNENIECASLMGFYDMPHVWKTARNTQLN